MSTDLAYAILDQLGRAKRGDDSLTIAGGDDPVFKTPWRIAHAGSAALGAVGLAVSDLWRLRTGKTQAVDVDRHAAVMSLRSNTYVLQNGKRPVSWDPLAGHYPTRDGRTMFLHTNHPHHRAGALRIAGAATDTKEAFAKIGLEPHMLGPREFGQVLLEEVRRWGAVARETGVKLE